MERRRKRQRHTNQRVSSVGVDRGRVFPVDGRWLTMNQNGPSPPPPECLQSRSHRLATPISVPVVSGGCMSANRTCLAVAHVVHSDHVGISIASLIQHIFNVAASKKKNKDALSFLLSTHSPRSSSSLSLWHRGNTSVSQRESVTDIAITRGSETSGRENKIKYKKYYHQDSLNKSLGTDKRVSWRALLTFFLHFFLRCFGLSLLLGQHEGIFGPGGQDKTSFPHLFFFCFLVFLLFKKNKKRLLRDKTVSATAVGRTIDLSNLIAISVSVFICDS